MSTKLRILFFLVLPLFAAICLAAQQDLYISSAGTNSVKRYDGVTGAYLGDFVAPASGGLNQPQGLTFGPDGDLYVSSLSSGRVLKFNGTTGAFISVFTQGPLLTFPADMSWHNGFLYVSDFGGTAVHRYDPLTGAYLGVFTNAPVAAPDGLSWDASGNLYVSCFTSNSIRKFDSNGVFIGDFVAPGGVSSPLDSRFGADGNLYVNSFNTGNVQEFNGTTGALIATFISGLGTTQGQIIGPDGSLFVGSYNGNHINRYNATTGAALGVFATGGGLVHPNNFEFAPIPGPLSSVTVSPTLVSGNVGATGTVTLAAPAPAGGTVVSLSSSAVQATVPANVTVPAGLTTATFSITTSNASYNPVNAAIKATIGSAYKVTILSVYPGNGGQFVSQSVFNTMTARRQFIVTLNYKNTGQTTWDAAHAYALQSRNPTNNTTWGINRIPLTNAPVAPGATGIFSAQITAPATVGIYPFQWIPIEGSIGAAFGQLSPNVDVNVTNAGDAASFVSRTGATGVFAGADFFVQNTMKNEGTNTWRDSTGYTMVTINPLNNTTWGGNSIHLPTNIAQVAPGASVTFARQCTAPITPGTYTMQWQMNHSGVLFGDPTPVITFTVFPAADNAQFLSVTSFPRSLAPGGTFSATFSMKNLGSATWNAANYSLSSVGTNNFGVASIAAGAVATNGTGTFTGNFTAPATPGTYAFRFRMKHGTVAFGQSSPSVNIVVSADAAQYISRSGATSVFAGADFFATYTMKNTGSTTWTAATGYSLSILPSTDTTWTANRINVPGSIAPSSSLSNAALCTAPITPGTYTMQWQMMKSGVLFGETTPVASIVVVLGADDAQYVSEVGIPATIVHGQTFVGTVTMKNLGTATWDGTYSLVPTGTNAFGVTGIAATSTVQNANRAFTATFTAPATPGTYTFRMRMQHGTTKFGQPTPSVTITVT